MLRCLTSIVMSVVFFSILSPAVGLGVEARFVHLDQLWKTDPDEAPFFNSIKEVLQNSDGEFIVLDSRSLTIHVFGGDGTHTENINLYGEGPGEISRLVDIAIDEHDDVFLLSPFGPTIVNMQAKWEPTSQSRGVLSDITGDMSSGFSLDTHGGKFLVSSIGSYQTDNEVVFQAFSKDGFEELEKVATFPVQERARLTDSEQDYYFANHHPWCVSSEGDLFITHSWSNEDEYYQIDKLSLDGDLQLTLKKKREKKKRTTREIGQVEELLLGGPAMVAMVKKMRNTSAPIKIAEYSPDITHIFEYGSEIWVQPSGKQERAGVFRRFDVFSKSGEELSEVLMACEECDSVKDELYIFGNMAIVVKGMYDKSMSSPLGEVEGADPLQIICYRIVERESL